jgi:iron complex outermembrane receptor protein
MTRSAFALGVIVSALAACAPNPNGMGVADYGTVTGRIVDTDSLQPITGATIAIGNIVSITASVDQGGFVLRNVPVGTQTVTISAIGWQPYRTTVKVAANKPADVGVIGLASALSR